ncbi:uncharacterized protein ISCGN_011427 [Ixodes scapularis]
MGACSALGCKNRVRCGKNRTTRNSGVSFHRFPKKKELQDAWVAAMKRNGWRPNSSSLLCSVHFREEDMDRTSRSCIRLRDNVVPSLFPERKRRRSLGSSSLVAPVDGDHCYGMPVPSDMDTSLGKSEHSEEVTTDTADQDDNSCGDLQCFADAAMCIPRIVSVTGSQQHASTAEVQRPAILVQQLMATTCTSSLRDHIRLLKVGQYPSASTSHSSLSGPAAKTSIMPDLPSNEMDEKMQLWDTIQKFRSLHNADRKKIKSLQECVRRLRVRNEKLKKALADKSASLPMTKLEFCKMDESQRKTLTLRYMDPPCCCCSEDT